MSNLYQSFFQRLSKCTNTLTGHECLHQIQEGLQKVDKDNYIIILNHDNCLINANPSRVISVITKSETESKLISGPESEIYGLNILAEYESFGDVLKEEIKSKNLDLEKALNQRGKLDQKLFLPLKEIKISDIGGNYRVGNLKVKRWKIGNFSLTAHYIDKNRHRCYKALTFGRPGIPG